MKNQSENKVYTLAEVLGKHTIAELKQMTQVLESCADCQLVPFMLM